MDFFVWQRTCVDDAGNVLASASVTVTDAVSGSLATLYSDEGSTGIGNPVTADADGFVQFYVKAGFYNITATSGGSSRTWTKEAIGAPHKRTAAEISAGVTPVDYRYMPTPIRDISRYVSDNTGATDVLAEFQAAINVEKNEIIVPDGTYLLDGTLKPKSGTGIFGNGQNTILKLADGANVPVIAFASDDLDYVDVHLRSFAIDGNKANQTDTDAHGISLTNAGGTSTLLARHRLQDLYIFNTKGDGLRLGFAMRSSHIKGIECYHCDGVGLHLFAHSDSIIEDCIIGQSGLQGVVVNGAGTVQMSDVKSWFSGRLGNAGGDGPGGLNGAGFWIRNTAVFIGKGLVSQENEGHGLHAFGQGDPIQALLIEGFCGDGDNKEGGAFHSVNLSNVRYARITGRAGSQDSLQGTPVNGVNVADTVLDFDIAMSISGQSGAAVAGAGIGNGTVRVNGDRLHFVEWLDDFLGDSIDTRWNTATGTDPQAIAAGILAGQTGGLCRLATGNDGAGDMATNGSQLDAGLNWNANAGGLVIEVKLQMSAITDVAVFVGFTDQAGSLEMPFTLGASDTLTSNATDACGVLFDTGADTHNWWLVGVANDVDATAQDSEIAPTAATFEAWRIVFSNTGTASFFRKTTGEWEPVGSAMSGAVTPSTKLTPVVAAFSRGAATRNIDIDYIRVSKLR